MDYSWPGNIRELQHLLERHAVAASSDLIDRIDLPVDPHAPGVSLPGGAADGLSEKEAIVAALRKCNGKVSGKGGAAELMGINANTLSTRMRKLGIRWKFIIK